MVAALNTIKVAYEEEQMSPEDIAIDQSLSIEAVKGALMQCSSKYRKDCGQEDVQEDDLNFSNDELRRVNQVITDLALSAEDEHLRFKAATYIRDDKKGRKEVVKNQKDSNINIFNFNERIAQIREASTKMVSSALGQKAINV